MKAYTFFILFFMPFLSHALDRYQDGDTLHVLALSGLNMRNASTLNSDKVSKIPYGEELVVLQDNFAPVPFSVTEEGGVLIEGSWVYVNYRDTFGYVFDGYLSHLPAPDVLYDADQEGVYIDSYQYYLTEILGKNGQPTDVFFYENENPPTPCRWTQAYGDKVLYTEYGCEESGFHATLHFMGVSFEEVYLLSLIMFFQEGEDEVDNQYNGNIEIGPQGGGAGCYHTLSEITEGEYRVSIYCGC